MMSDVVLVLDHKDTLQKNKVKWPDVSTSYFTTVQGPESFSNLIIRPNDNKISNNHAVVKEAVK